MTRRSSQVRDRVRAVLERHLATVDSPKMAAAIVQRAHETTDGASEADRADAAKQASGSASTDDAAAEAEVAYDVLDRAELSANRW